MIVAALLLLAGARVAVAAQLPIESARLQPRNDSMVVSVKGRTVGWYTSRVTRNNDGIKVSDELSVGELAHQRTEIDLDRNGRMRRVQLGGFTTGVQIRASLEYNRNRVRGVTVASLQQLVPDSESVDDTTKGQSVVVVADTVLPPWTIDDNAMLVFLPALPWANGARWSVAVFSGQANVIREVTLTVLGSASVGTAAGPVDTWEVDVSGGMSPVKYYVSQSLPHRLVRMEFPSVGLVYTRVE